MLAIQYLKSGTFLLCMLCMGIGGFAQNKISDPPISVVSEGYCSVGDSLFSLREYKHAIPWYTKALDVEHKGKYQLKRGRAKAASGDHEGAIQDYLICLRVSPKHFATYYYLGKSEYILGNYDEAIKFYTKAYRKCEKNLARLALAARGDVYYATEEKEKARKDWEKAKIKHSIKREKKKK